MDYPDKDISQVAQVREQEAVYEASADRQQIFSHQLSRADIDRSRADVHPVISDEEIAEGYMSLEEFDQHLTDFIRSKYDCRR